MRTRHHHLHLYLPASPPSHVVCPLLLVSLTIGFGSIVTLVHDEVFGSVVVATGEVRLKDRLDTSGVAFLGIDGCARHVGDHGIATTPWVLSISERMVLGCGLREPHVTAIAVEMAGFQGLGNVFLNHDGTTSSVDEPRT